MGLSKQKTKRRSRRTARGSRTHTDRGRRVVPIKVHKTTETASRLCDAEAIVRQFNEARWWNALKGTLEMAQHGGDMNPPAAIIVALDTYCRGAGTPTSIMDICNYCGIAQLGDQMMRCAVCNNHVCWMCTQHVFQPVPKIERLLIDGCPECSPHARSVSDIVTRDFDYTYYIDMETDTEKGSGSLSSTADSEDEDGRGGE